MTESLRASAERVAEWLEKISNKIEENNKELRSYHRLMFGIILVAIRDAFTYNKKKNRTYNRKTNQTNYDFNYRNSLRDRNREDAEKWMRTDVFRGLSSNLLGGCDCDKFVKDVLTLYTEFIENIHLADKYESFDKTDLYYASKTIRNMLKKVEV